jgi:hypothetical protein
MDPVWTPPPTIRYAAIVSIRPLAFMGRMFRFGKSVMREKDLNLIFDVTMLIGEFSQNSYFVSYLQTSHDMNWRNCPETSFP